MSFIGEVKKGTTYAAGYFLAHEECVRVTVQATADNAAVKTTAEGGKYIPVGTIYPTADAEAKGILYEDVDVTTGDMPASLVTSGVVVESRLPQAEEGKLPEAAKTALEKLGFKFVDETAVERPY